MIRVGAHPPPMGTYLFVEWNCLICTLCTMYGTSPTCLCGLQNANME